LFDIDSGAELMTLTAGDHGVLSILGGDGFGSSVAIHGNFALVGAPDDSELADRSGAAYLFDIRTGKLIDKILLPVGEKQKKFGRNVALTSGHALIDDRAIVNFELVSTTYVYAIPESCTIVLTILALGFGSCRLRRRFIRSAKRCGS
jgi:hypothetical protein